MKLIKRDLFYKLVYDIDLESYFIYCDNELVYRFYSSSKNNAIRVYNEFLKGSDK